MDDTPKQQSAGVRLGVWLVAVFALWAGDSIAGPRWLTVSNALDGSVIVTLNVVGEYCDGLYLVPFSPTTAITGQGITITSTNYFFDCAAPPTVLPPPVTYSLAVNVGHLSDGTYTVQWLFPGAGPMQPPVLGGFSVQLRVVALGAAVPALNTVGLALLMLSVLWVGALGAKANEPRRHDV